ncbi:tol-pal system protein YbgF [Chelatococcus sp. SYSU_G07232]|uniref:Cell division coordinator CpoB n=1 Tax=Chelatococcus albus TaxID=3047466 RepID=A0ABT7AFT2_9HYPH|nr:tol-pal system protein YbgF [Chelatococcus sp. SYSU_G07232]MDJ1158238.1 tol-pal system protein YbgF [Chelatococcus sp. SYSU_G07232]
MFARRLSLFAVAAALLLAGALASGPTSAQDAAELFVRLNRLEGQMREMSGRMEQLQYENRRLQEQLKRFQEDVEFRFQERAGSSGAPPAQPRNQRRGDAFDPSGAPGAPGAPQPLGSTRAASATPGAASTGGVAVMDEGEGELAPPLPRSAPRDIGTLAREVAAPPGPRSGPSIAATGSADPRQDYDVAMGLLQQKQYEQAEMSFRQFLQSHPRDKLVPEATYWLGESYAARGRHREAAEQFLKVTTDHPKAGRAPESLLKLGMSLNAIGAREQACATYGEIARKYPQAAAGLKASVEREQRRAKC